MFLTNSFHRETSKDKILAIDLGRKSLKLALYRLQNGEIELIKRETIEISDENQFECLKDFDWVATKVWRFLGEKYRKSSIRAGLVVSDILDKTTLNSGCVLGITEDNRFESFKPELHPARCLSESFQRMKLNIDVYVLVNEAIATLMSVDKKEKEYRIAIISDTKTNATCF